MLIFRNPGLIDMQATTTLGVSVKNPGSFGFFGTGFKFGVATVLRGGGAVAVYRGKEEHLFSAQPTMIRGEEFQIVTLNGVPLGFTTQLGRNWEPWMALREFGCNARDEGGEFRLRGDDENPAALLDDDHTTIIVDWPEMEQAYKQRADLFVDDGNRELLFQNEELRIFVGTASHVFYRGVRAHKLEKPSLFTYDILSQQMLTEDRTLASTWNIDRLIRDAALVVEDVNVVRPIITANSGFHEAKLDFQGGLGASRTFLDAATAARESREHMNESAKKVLLRHIRKAAAEEQRHGGYTRYRTDAFSYAVEKLATIGIEFPEDQEFITVPELPGEAMTTYESGRIYVLDSLTTADPRLIAEQLLLRWVDKTVKGYDQESVTLLLTPLLLDQIAAFKRDKALVEEDEAQAEPTLDNAESADVIAAEQPPADPIF